MHEGRVKVEMEEGDPALRRIEGQRLRLFLEPFDT